MAAHRLDRVRRLAQAGIAYVILWCLSHTAISTTVGLAATNSPIRLVVASLVGLTCMALGLRAILVGHQRIALAGWLDLVSRTAIFAALIGASSSAGMTSDAVRSFLIATLLGAVIGASLYLLG